MRKSLSYKILAALMAAGSFGLYAATPAAAEEVKLMGSQLRANGNAIVIKNNKLTTPSSTAITTLSENVNVYGIGYNESEEANFYTDPANDGNVTITGSTFDKVYGGFTVGVIDENTTANSNEVKITNSDNNRINYVYGGYSSRGSANKNIVKIDGGNYGVVIGGHGSSANPDEPDKIFSADGNVVSISNKATVNGQQTYIIGGSGYTAKSNIVEITDSTITINSSMSGYALTGGYAYSGGASYNQIIITDSTISGNVYGGYIGTLSAVSANNNSITVTGKSDITNANLYGYGIGTNSSATGSGNTLTLNGWSGTVNSLHNFDSIIFENIDLSQKEITLNVTGEVSRLVNDFTININSANAKNFTLTAGDYAQDSTVAITTIKWDADLGNKVAFGSDFNNSLPQIDTDAYYFADRENNDGIYVNRLSNLQGTDSNINDYQAEITATVTKSILTGKFIDENGAHYNSNQTENTASLTIGNGFNTKVGIVAGTYAAGSKNAENGVVNISGNNISYDGIVYAGYSENGSANSNTINVAADTIASKMTLSGGNTGSDNVLNLEGSATFKAINKFDAINFDKIDWINGGTVLNITDNAEDGALANTNINLNSLNFVGGTELNAGESMTIISNNNSGKNLGIGTGKVDALSNFTAGVAIEGTGTAEVAADGNSVKYTLTKVKHTDQIDLVAENRAVAAAFVNQGTDLISDSLDTISRDDNYGVKTFAAVHGNRSKYDVNSDIKINGWSVIAGVGNADKFDNGSEFSWGVFYENGSGNYRTYNEFNNEFFRGDGSLVYNGGGIAARYTNKNGVYTEGSLRAGMLKSDMDNALRDGAGNFYGYESESAYYGAHLGVGKIISLSESSDLDVYGKFFHTYTEGDSFKVAGDEFVFDSINSDRLRIGARITSNKENKFSTYYGLAYEYEFNGDADMTAQGLKAPTQSLHGSSVMAEIGFNYQPTPTSPWSFDLNMRGYTGERQGGSFNVQATYTF